MKFTQEHADRLINQLMKLTSEQMMYTDTLDLAKLVYENRCKEDI